MSITFTEGIRPPSKPQVHEGNTTIEVTWPTLVRNAEASELGLKPGQWPQRLTTDLGNRQDFVLVIIEANGTRRYSQAHGLLTLRIFND